MEYEKMEKMKNRTTIKGILINIACILAIVIVVFPLLWLAQYNYPSADDWSYGASGYQVIKSGGSFFEVLKASINTTWQTYMNVEGRFVGIFLATLQPGIWGEKYYVVVPFILIGAIVFSEMLLFKSVLCEGCKKENKWLWLPVVAPMLIMQILYCPFTEESFYWYTGSMYYTFSYGLSLVLLVLFWRLATKEYSKGTYAVMAVAAGLLAVMVGGMNFGTSLACLLSLLVLSFIFIIYNRKALFRTWFVTLLEMVSLMLCVFAPGNTNRINNNFGGETEGALEAVWMSLVRSFTNIYSWTNIKVILMIMFVIPFLWKCLKNIKWKFRFPGIFTLMTFGLYASQSAPTMYVNGTTGGGRMAAVLFYSYFVWIVGNIIYWLGWLSKRQYKAGVILDKIQSKFGKWLISYCVLVSVLLVGLIYVTDLRQISSYRAYRDWKQGWAEQYAYEWEARLEILHDDSIKEVEFQPLSVFPEVIMYTDLQDENGYLWVNEACATYYDKESIKITGK